MTDERPKLVGEYDLVQDFVNNNMSIRVLQMDGDDNAVGPHVHYRSSQVYIGLSGKAAITCDGVEHIVNPYDIVSIPVRSLHAARAVDGPAVVMNISVPPLRADDQSPSLGEKEAPDMRMPSTETDVDD